MLTKKSNTKLRWMVVCAPADSFAIGRLRRACCCAHRHTNTTNCYVNTAYSNTCTTNSDADPPSDETSEILSGYADNNGVRIYYEVEGEGPPLVLVPWATGSTEDWRMFGYVNALKDDYQLILVDMRGHGQSDKPPRSRGV